MKQNLLKVFYIIINLLTVTGLIAFCYFNIDKTVEYFCPILQKNYSTYLILPIFIFYILAFISGYTVCSIIKQKLADTCNAYAKRHENISVENESDKAKIQTLEAKILTLETALKKALDNK